MPPTTRRDFPSDKGVRREVDSHCDLGSRLRETLLVVAVKCEFGNSKGCDSETNEREEQYN